MQPTILLYCFPHAGGTTQVFRHWQAALPPHVRVRLVERPGSGARLSETRLHEYELLVDTLAQEIARDIVEVQRNEGPVRYASFGHSAGAMFSFGVCTRLTDWLQQPPLHCFLSAGMPPHIERKPRSYMTDADLIREMRELSGTPPEVLEHPELLSLFLPMFRADVAAHEGASVDIWRRLHCPVTLFAGTHDPLLPEIVWAWRWYTGQETRQVLLQGDHFSVLHSPAELLSHVTTTLSPEVRQTPPVGVWVA